MIGGAGFIGSHVVEELLKEDVAEVLIFDNFTRGTRENIERALNDSRVKVFSLGGEILHRDILLKSMEGVDGVFHLAALWLLHCYDFSDSAFEVNVRGTYNVIDSVIHSGVHRLVYSSSASVYGDAVTDPMKENHPFHNTNFYGATKISGEAFCRSLYHRHKDNAQAFEYVGLRYMNVYGPRQDYRGAYVAVIMKILDRIEQGLRPIVHGDGSQAYDFVYVKDCARANVAAMKADICDEFYNVGTGVRTTIKELTERLLKLTGCSLRIQYEAADRTFVKNRVGCPEKAKRDLGFTARMSLDEGLKELIEWRNAHKQP